MNATRQPQSETPEQAPSLPAARPVSTRRHYVMQVYLRAWLAALLLAVLLAMVACSSSALPTSPGVSTTANSVPAAATDLEQTAQTVIERVQPSIVEVQSSGGQGQGIGSGEVIGAGGYIVTNDHVVRGFQQYTVVLATGQSLSANLAGEAPGDDLALLKVQASSLRPITFGDSNAVRVGSFALAIGSPLGLQQSATFGIVSAVNRTASEAPSGPASTLTGLIQTSAPINLGNSGGALVNLRGELIGIPTLGASDPNSGGAAYGIGFAISSNRVKFITDQLVKGGRVTSTGQGFLGITGADVTADLAATYGLPVNRGVLIGGLCPMRAARARRRRLDSGVGISSSRSTSHRSAAMATWLEFSWRSRPARASR